MTVAAQAADKVTQDCKETCPNDGTCTGLCDGCLSGIVLVYEAFSGYLDSIWQEVQTTYDAQMNHALDKIEL